MQAHLAGIALRKVWGLGRFDGVAPLRSLWLVPPGMATELTVPPGHVIRTLSLSAATLREAGGPGEFGALRLAEDAFDVATAAVRPAPATTRRGRVPAARADLPCRGACR